MSATDFTNIYSNAQRILVVWSFWEGRDCPLFFLRVHEITQFGTVVEAAGGRFTISLLGLERHQICSKYLRINHNICSSGIFVIYHIPL